MLGLTLARRLAASGKEVTVFEAAPDIGGLASAWTIDDVVWDRFYHVMLSSDEAILDLLADLGLADAVNWDSTRTGVLTDGKLHSVSNAVEYLRYPALGLVAKLRMAATILYAARIKDWQRLERIPVATWLERWSGEAAFEKFWRPLLIAKLGQGYRDASAAFIWATIQRLFAARQDIRSDKFGFVAGGYARTLDALAGDLASTGIDVRTGAPVARVARVGDDVAVTLAQGDKHEFDDVIVTLAPPIASRIIEGLSAGETSALETVAYLGVVCPSLLLDAPLAGFYVTNITDPALFTGVIEMTALTGPLGGRHLIYLPKYVRSDDAFFDKSDSEVVDSFVAELARLYPGFDPRTVVAARVARARYVMAAPTIDYSRRVSPPPTSVPGVWLVNSSQIINGTLNVNETVELANAGADRLLASWATQR